MQAPPGAVSSPAPLPSAAAAPSAASPDGPGASPPQLNQAGFDKMFGPKPQGLQPNPTVEKVKAQVAEQSEKIKGRRDALKTGGFRMPHTPTMAEQARQAIAAQPPPSRTDLGYPAAEVEAAAAQARQAAGITPAMMAQPVNPLASVPSPDALIERQMEGMQPGQSMFFNQHGQQYAPNATSVTAGGPSWRAENPWYDPKFDYLPFLGMYGVTRDLMEKVEAGQPAAVEKFVMAASLAGLPSLFRGLAPGKLGSALKTAGALPSTSPAPYGTKYAKALERLADDFVKDERGTLAGSKAVGANLPAMQRARGALAEGTDPKKVVKQTGWHEAPGGRMAFEISDKNAKLKPWPADIGNRRQARRRVKLSELLDHEELYELYPELKDIEVVSLGRSALGGVILPNAKTNWKPLVFVNAMDLVSRPKRVRMTLLHEIQHLIQGIEGWPRGTSTSIQADKFREAIESADDAVRAGAEAELSAQVRAIENANGFRFRELSVDQQGRVIDMAVNNVVIDRYNLSAGEAMARAVELRSNQAPATQAKKPFWEAYRSEGKPVDQKELIVEWDVPGELPSGEMRPWRMSLPAMLKEEPASMVPGPARSLMTAPVLVERKYAADLRAAAGVESLPTHMASTLAKPVTSMVPDGPVRAASMTDPPMPELGARYPEVGPAVERTNAGGGKYLGKGYSDEEEALKKIMPDIQDSIDAGDYRPYFDISKRADVDPKRYPLEGDTLKSRPAKDATIAKHMPKARNPEARKRILAAFERGKQLPGAADWYFMAQLEKEFIKELGAKAGREAFRKKFSVAMAATTGGADPRANFRMAMYGNWLDERGLPYPQATHEIPYPAGGKTVVGNYKQHRKAMEEMGFSWDKNSKRFNFQGAFEGHRVV